MLDQRRSLPDAAAPRTVLPSRLPELENGYASVTAVPGADALMTPSLIHLRGLGGVCGPWLTD